MARQFEVFTGRSKPASNKVMRVVLNKRGIFSLNQATFLALGEPKAVELLYDRQNQVIGMKTVPEDTRHAYPVRTQKNAKSYLIGARAFSAFYELDIKDRLSFEPVMEDEVLVLEMGTALSVAPRARRNGKASASASPSAS